MSLLDTLNQKPALGYGVALGALALAGLFLLLMRSPERTTFRFDYYYDLTSREVFQDQPSLPAPFTRPSGSLAVRAHMYGCGGCDGELFLGYLSKYNDEARKVATLDDSREAADTRRAGMMVRLPDDPDDAWVQQLSDQGLAKTRSLVAKCPDGRLKACFGQ